MHAMEEVFRALADPSRRALRDRRFAAGGQTLGQLAAGLPMTRQAVTKHLAILEAANLVSVHWRGREKLHYLNPVPIGEIVKRWVGKFEDARIEALTDLKSKAETREKKRA
jgi:DNA-binding transcriptional ArsR family regulator